MKHKKSRKRLPKVVAKTLVALIFSVFFLLPIVLTITNSFMSSTEISANYGKVFSSVDDTKGREYIGEKVNLKSIPDMVSFEQYWNVLLKSPDYLLKFWNSVLYVVPITVFQLVVASLAAYSFTRFSGKKKTILFFDFFDISKDFTFFTPKSFKTFFLKSDSVSSVPNFISDILSIYFTL